MGQQQLLLIVLGVIIVGLAIVVGINLFRSNAVDSNRNAVSSDLYHLAYLANAYYKRPVSFGGGGNSFVGFTFPSNLSSTQNGTYSIFAAGTASSIVFEGIGIETGNNGTSAVKLQITVTTTTDNITILN